MQNVPHFLFLFAKIHLKNDIIIYGKCYFVFLNIKCINDRKVKLISDNFESHNKI